MRHWKLLILAAALLLLCACGRDGRSDDEDKAPDAAQIGAETAEAWLELVTETDDGVEAPDMAAILREILAEDPDATIEELGAAVQDALEEGDYELVILPEADGTDDPVMDALEVMLAELWAASIADAAVEPVDTPWGRMGS